MTGFWVLFPLAMLSFTGAWISFPKVFGQFESRPPPPARDREAAARARPLATASLGVDGAIAAAPPIRDRSAYQPSTWPTDQKPEWKIAVRRPTAALSRSRVDDATGTGRAALRRRRPRHSLAPCAAGTTAPAWAWAGRSMIFLGGIIPALLSITGIIIWWRAARGRGSGQRTARRLT